MEVSKLTFGQMIGDVVVDMAMFEINVGNRINMEEGGSGLKQLSDGCQALRSWLLRP